MKAVAEDTAEGGQTLPPNFPDGEKLDLGGPAVSVISEAKILAKRFLDRRAASVEEEVESTVALSDGLSTLKDDPSQLKEFLEELAAAKVLSADEVSDGLSGAKKSSSTLSKLKKIKAHRRMVLDARILPFLQPGYTVLYSLVQLYEEIAEVDDPIDRLHDLLKASPGPITRESLDKERKAITSGKEVTPVPPVSETASATEAKSTSEVATPVGESTGTPAVAEAKTPERTGTQLAASKKAAAIVLMTVTNRDAEKLLNAGNGNKAKYRTIVDSIGKRGMLLVHAKLATMLSLAAAIEAWGFTKCSRIYLAAKPSGPDASNQMVLAVYERGGVKVVNPVDGWTNNETAAEFASRVVSGVDARRLHLFAKSDVDGWETTVGDDNWMIAE